MLNKLGGNALSNNGNGPLLLNHLFPATCMDLDATVPGGYDGAGAVWANLTPVPADGSAQTVFDFYRGVGAAAHTDDPVFTGTPGSPEAYWSLDGGDGFKQVGSSTSLGNIHKSDGGSFTLIAGFQFQVNNLEQRILTTQANGTSGLGISLALNSSKKLFLRQRGDTGSVVGLLSPVTFVAGTNYLCIASCNRATNTARYWVNSRTGTDVALTFVTSTGAAQTAAIGARATLDLDFMAAGTLLYNCAMLNTAIDDAAAARIFNIYNARHGRIYA